MKKIFLFLSACTLLLVGTTMAQNVVVSVKKTATPITIDGNEDAAWAQADTITIDYWTGRPAPNPDDFKAYFRLLWDDNYFYCMFYVEDDDLMTQDRAAALKLPDWEVDGWQVSWSPNNSKKPNMTEVALINLSYANSWSSNPCATTKQGWGDGSYLNGVNFVQAAMKDLGTGYNIEASFDLGACATAAGLQGIGANDTVGFCPVAGDIDFEETARSAIGLPIVGYEWNKATVLMRLILSGTGGSGGTAIKNANSFAWRVYPNPVANELRFTSNITLSSLEIYNTEGKLVLKAIKPNGSVNVSMLPAGLYAVKATATNGKTYSQKIIKK